MKVIKRKRSVAVLLALAVLALAAVGAYAYFTTNGSGTGTATVGTSNAFTVDGSTTGSLYPGTTVPVAFQITNNGTGNQKLNGDIYLANVRACSAGGTWTGTYAGGSCSTSQVASCESVDPGNAADANASNWYMADVTDATDYAPGGPVASGSAGVLKMNNLNSSQDLCKSVGLKLFFATR